MKKDDFQLISLEFHEGMNFIKKFNGYDLTKKPLHKFSIGLILQNRLVGVAMVGLPGSLLFRHRSILQVTCVSTDGTKDAASKLYVACWRICRKMGYSKLITFVPVSDDAGALKNAGWMRSVLPRNNFFQCDMVIMLPDKKALYLTKYYICDDRKYNQSALEVVSKCTS